MKIASPLDKPSAVQRAQIQIPGHPPLALAYAEWEPVDAAYRGTVVAVHGLTRQKHDFDFVAATLAQNGYQVLAVDAPGRGDSSWLSDPNHYNLDFYADAFVAFLKHMGLTRVHWIGSSMGGLIALRMAEKGRGGMLRSLILVDITHKPARQGLERIMSYLTGDLPVFQNPQQYLEIMKKNLPMGDMTPDYVWEHYAKHQLKRTPQGYAFHFDPKIMIRATEDFKGTMDLSAGMKKISCPVALVAGGASDICTEAEIAEAKVLQPELAVHICHGAGHVPSLADAAAQQFIYRVISGA